MINKKKYTIVVNLPGGIVATGYLYTALQALAKAGIQEVQLGTRQQLFVKVNAQQLTLLETELGSHYIAFEFIEKSSPNIVSSYVNEGVFENSNWLSEGVYKDVLNLFDFTPQLKINLVDNTQTFVPYFTGNLNFIASKINNYWYLYLRYPQTNQLYLWPVLIYTTDIPLLSKQIEPTLQKLGITTKILPADWGTLVYKQVNLVASFITHPITEALHVPTFMMPYYEGFNRYGNKSWLGIYRRDEVFSVAFLLDVCSVCIQTKIGQVYTTPWKSIVVKGIENADRKLWDYVLSKHRINVRHAANELNWQIEDMCSDGLNLKRYLIRQFDKDDVRTFGLCFAVKTMPNSSIWGSVIIEKKNTDHPAQRKSVDKYDIWYTQDFNPNSKEYVLFRSDVAKENIATYLISLCKYFYELKNDEEGILHRIYREDTPTAANTSKEPPTHFVHQCKHCFTIYDCDLGDTDNGIPPGTDFSQLPEHYACNTCEAPKQDFVMVIKKTAAVL